MKVKKIFAVVLAMVMICSMAASCSIQVGHSDNIEGKWKSIDSKTSTGFFTFKDDGTVIIEGLGYEIEGTYKVDGDEIEIEYGKSVYTDYEGKETKLPNGGLYSKFDEKTKKASGRVNTLDSFSGKFIIYEANNKDCLEILFIDPDNTDVMTIGGKEFKGVTSKWRFERSYESSK